MLRTQSLPLAKPDTIESNNNHHALLFQQPRKLDHLHILSDDTIVLSDKRNQSRRLDEGLLNTAPQTEMKTSSTPSAIISETGNANLHELPDNVIDQILNNLDKYDRGKMALCQQSSSTRRNPIILSHAFPVFVKVIHASQQLSNLNKTLQISRFIPRITELDRDLRIKAIEPLSEISNIFSDFELKRLITKLLPSLHELRPSELASAIETRLLAIGLMPPNVRGPYLIEMLEYMEAKNFPTKKAVSDRDHGKELFSVDVKSRLLEISISALNKVERNQRSESLFFISRLLQTIPDAHMPNILSKMLIFTTREHAESMEHQVKSMWDRTRDILKHDPIDKISTEKHLVMYLDYIAKLPKSQIGASAKDALDAQKYNDNEIHSAIKCARKALMLFPEDVRLIVLHNFYEGLSTRSFPNDHIARYELSLADIHFPESERLAIREELSKLLPFVDNEGKVSNSLTLHEKLSTQVQPMRDLMHLLYVEALLAKQEVKSAERVNP